MYLSEHNNSQLVNLEIWTITVKECTIDGH